MNRALYACALALFLVLPVLSGCGEQFTDVEMHLGSEEKVRPYAVLCDPPEVAPGDSVTVTLLCWAPDPAALAVDWQVALDYDLGPYESEEIERRIVDLDEKQFIAPPVDTGDGFLRQSFTYVVPDSVLLWSSALPSPLADGAMVALAGSFLPGEEALSKTSVAAWLRGLTPADLSAMDAGSRARALGLADRFAVRIRFRATLHAGITVDVTRNLTVRYSSRLESPNTNTNPEIQGFEVIGIPHPDVDDPDAPEYAGEIVHYPFAPGEGEVPESRVPRREGWTYYLVMTGGMQEYTSPYSGDRLFTEVDSYRWYYLCLDDPGSGHALFRDDAGEETEMWALEEHVRLEPPAGAGEMRYRVVGCLRDERPEWIRYQAAPGGAVMVGDVVFGEGRLELCRRRAG